LDENFHNIAAVLDGDIDALLEKLVRLDQTRRLEDVRAKNISGI
jgi:hypothetical protein